MIIPGVRQFVDILPSAPILRISKSFNVNDADCLPKSIYRDLIKPLGRLKPGINVDPTSGPHNRTLCDSAFFRFDPNAGWRFFNSALPTLAGVKGIAVPDEWKEMSAAEQFAERISGLYEWDRHIGIPSAGPLLCCRRWC